MRLHAVACTLAATWTCASTVAAIAVRLRLRKPVGVKSGNTPSYPPRICSRTLMVGCFVPLLLKPHQRPSRRSSPRTLRFLLTCALLTTSSHSEGGYKSMQTRWCLHLAPHPGLQAAVSVGMCDVIRHSIHPGRTFIQANFGGTLGEYKTT